MNDTFPSKVADVTLAFWIMKVLATTLGETGGDAVSMSIGLGYLVGTAVFAVAFAIIVAVQIRADRFHPALYWLTIVATTTVGTTLADFADRSLGIGYAGGSLLLLVLLLGSFFLWHRMLGSVAIESIRSPRAEAYYWVTIMFSQTLGTALGDWTADSAGFGYTGAMLIFGSLLAIVAGLYFWSRISHTILFWAAFVLTRPLGAVLGDFLDKPLDEGGLALSRFAASAVLIGLIAFCLVLFPQRAAERAH
ncbi:MAG: COG4705 family protein [Burkholderiales bacterium]